MSTAGGRTPPRRFAVGLAAVPLLAIFLADGVLVARHSQEPKHTVAQPHPVPTVTRTSDAEQRAEMRRTASIRALLAQRSDAVLTHNRAEWASTIDPSRKAFLRAQLAMFDHLADVPLASWSYSWDHGFERTPTARSSRYAVPSWAPQEFALHYRLRGFDTRATNLQQYPTFTRRHGEWRLASLNDFTGRGLESAVDIWDFGPVSVVRRSNVLVLGHPGNETTMQAVATEVASDIPRVSEVWGHDWAQRAVIVLPSTQHELSRVVDDGGNLDHIAAVATAEVKIGTGRPDPVGDRIGINPANWSKLSALGQRIVLTHELTHVASRAVTSGSTPSWLAEGFADYVGYLDSGVPTPFVAQDLATDVRNGHVPTQLPTDPDFAGDSKTLSQSYEGSWLACTLIAQRYGQSQLVHFYRAVGRSHVDEHVATKQVFRSVLHISQSVFVHDWRDFVRAQLG